MNTSESIKEIAKAIIAVMKETKGVEKNLSVGTGNNAYKGVSDQDVKKEIGRSMEKHGLAIVPIDVEPQFQIDRWEEIDQYSKVAGATKTKQQVFTSVKTKYLLLHESGEWIELSGYGHGVDTQDKAAGKASTYALKYTLLYTFLVPTGKIDDADSEHSDDQPVKKTTAYNHKPIGNGLPIIPNAEFQKLIEESKSGNKEAIEAAKKKYAMDESQINLLRSVFNKPTLTNASAQ